MADFKKLIQSVTKMNPWHFLWVGVILSEVFTFLMNSLLSYLWWGHISIDLLQIGAIDAFVVALLVSLIVIYFINRVNKTRTLNEMLEKEITIRNEAQDALEKSEEKYRMLFEKAGDAIFILDASKERMGRIIDANKAAAEMHGYTVEELRNLNIRDLDSPEDRGMVSDRMKRIFSGEWIKSEIDHIRKDGSRFPVEISAGLIELDNAPYILAFDRDITQRKNLEARLRQSLKMESIGNLAGGVAHDFNNILAGIMGYAELIKSRSSQDPKIFSHAEQILKAGERAAGVIKQILLFSRKGDQKKIPTDMGHIADEVIALLRASIPSTIEVRHSIQENLHPISADPTQIHQVFMNLCSNAAYAMRDRGGYLEISLEGLVLENEGEDRLDMLERGHYIRLSISDTGHGMDQKTLERIFDPYFTTKKVGEGSGLGLATVLGIVKDHDGAIRVDSQEGIGTVFEVYFPALK